MRKLLIFCLLASCTQFPELEGTINKSNLDAPYVDFTPFDDVKDGPEPLPQKEADDLADRVAALRQRANNLRERTVNDPELRARIRDRNR